MQPFRFSIRFLALALLGAFTLATGSLTSASFAEDWPQFRGPNCSGVSTDSTPLPVTFSVEKNHNIGWSAKVGEGIGSPVVAAGRVFTLGMTDSQQISLFALDAKSGKKLWSRRWKTGPLAEVHKTNSHASTTPAADAEHVYFYFSTLGMLAVDAKTGEDAWQQKLPTPYFVFKWGPGMSPVLADDKVIFCQDDDLYPSMIALDKQTGKLLWKADRSEMAVNYSHPILVETKQGPELVVAGTGKLIGYDPNTGRQKWFARTLLRNIKTTPVTSDGVIYISLQSGGIANQWLATGDKNSDGRLTKEEMQAFVGEEKIPEAFFKKFDRGDTNKDGFLEGEELDKAFLDANNFAGARFDAPDPADQFILAVRGGGKGDVTKSHLLWKHESRAPDHICSPLLVEDRMFVVKGGGISSCFRTDTGKPYWYQKRIQNIGDYFASPIYGDGKIYVAGENGTVVVLESSPELKVLAKNDLGESILGTPAIADGRLFVRTRTKLICVSK